MSISNMLHSSHQPSAPALPAGVAPRSKAFRRISVAFFLAGFATFSLLYCVQPLLPVFAREFGVSAEGSSLALSLSTGLLSVAILCAAIISELVGRRGLMFCSMLGAAALSLAAAAAPTWPSLLLLRAALGVVLGGVPAVAMAYLAEEIDAKGLGAAMGLYVGGTAFGGMIGRMGTGILADHFGWRIALCIISASGMVAAIAFAFLVPASRRFVRRTRLEPAYHLRAWTGHLVRRDMLMLFACGFLIMGAFVTIYNYAGFRLMQPPYDLGQTVLGFVFGVYVFGIATSSLAGLMAAKLGRHVTLRLGLAVTGCGALLTWAADLPVIIVGIVVLTMGFFMTHSTASGWVGRLAQGSKGHASSLYLLAYYIGSSVAGSAGGYFWTNDGWGGVVEFTLALIILALVASLCMTHDGGERGQASTPNRVR